MDLEKRVRPDHPLRVIREIANAALAVLSGDFAALYSGVGRRSIAPEMLLRAMLLQAFYSIRPERQLMERLESCCSVLKRLLSSEHFSVGGTLHAAPSAIERDVPAGKIAHVVRDNVATHKTPRS